MFIATIFILLAIIAIVWLSVFFLLNDLSLPTVSIDRFKKILVVYPHPDDEVLTAGGVIKRSGNATLLTLTKGEKGTPDAHLDNRLKQIRSHELMKAAQILGVKKLIHMDMGDGELEYKKTELKKTIQEAIKKEKPDLIITYDLSGLYGHPDHMAVSQTVTDLIKKEYSNIHSWYFCIPKKIYRLLKLPTHMAKDNQYLTLRSYPTHKIYIGLAVFNKIIAMSLHHSQYHFWQGDLPIPSAFFHSMTLFEYFHKVN